MSDEELGALDNDDYDYQPVQPRNRGAARQPEVKPQKKDSFEEIDDDFLDDPIPAQKSQPKKQEESKKNSWSQPANKQQSKQYDNDNEFEEMDDYQDISQSKSIGQSYPKDSFGKQQQINKQQEEPEEKEDSYYEEYKYESDEDDSKSKQQAKQAPQPVQKQQNAYHYDDEEEEDKDNENQSQDESRRHDQQDDYDDYKDDYGEDFDEDDEEKENELSRIDEKHNGRHEQENSSDYQQDDENEDQEIDQTQNNDQSKMSYDQSQARNSTRRPQKYRKPPKGQPAKKESYVEKYKKVIAHTDYSSFSDQQLLKENASLRAKLKEISEEVSKLVDKAAAKPAVQQQKQISIENKIKILKAEIDTNEKKLKTQQQEILKLKQRIEQVGSPKYLTDLNEELKQITKTIDDKKKKNRQDQLEQNKKGKNLDQIENVAGIPESLQEKQKKSIELELLKRKNEGLQQQIAKVKSDIAENESKQPKISQALQEKREQAVKLKLDVDTDKQQLSLREKYNLLERKKLLLQKHLEAMRSKDGKVQIAENQVKDLKKLIAIKNNDINLIEMQIIEQRKLVDEARSRQNDGALKQYLPAAAQTQQNYNVQSDNRVSNSDTKQLRKLVSAKPSVQHQPNDYQSVQPKPEKEQIQPDHDKHQTKIQSNKPKEIIEEQALEESVQNDNLQFKINPQAQVAPQSQNQIQAQIQPQPQPQPINKNKPFTFKKSQPQVENEIKLDTQQKQPDANQLTFGKQEEKGLEFQIKQEPKPRDDENQLTFGNKGASDFLIKPETKPIIKQEDPPAIQTENNFPTRRMFRMGQRTEQNSSNISYDASDQQKSNIEAPKQQETGYDPIARQQVATKAPEPTSQITGYQISSGEQPVPQRRLRQGGMSNNTIPNSNDISIYGDTSQHENIQPQQPQQKEQIPAYEIPGAGGRRRNDGRSNQFSIQDNQAAQSIKPQQQSVEQSIDLRNDTSMTIQQNRRVENKQETSNQPMFNFSKKQTEAVIEQPQAIQKPIEQQPQQLQTQNKPAAGRRQNGPRKLDIWADEPQETNADIFNIKTINEVNPQPAKIEPTYQTKFQPQEEERELTLDEILGGGGGDKKETNTYQPYSLNTNTGASNNLSNQRRKPQQVSQTEKEKQLAQKAENQDFFGDFEV